MAIIWHEEGWGSLPAGSMRTLAWRPARCAFVGEMSFSQGCPSGRVATGCSGPRTAVAVHITSGSATDWSVTASLLVSCMWHGWSLSVDPTLLGHIGDGCSFKKFPECAAGLKGPHRWGVILPNSSRVSLLTYKAIVAVRYPELVVHGHGPLQIGHFVANDQTVERGGFRAVFWDAPKDLRTAVEDIVGLLEYLKNLHRNIRQGTTSQLLVLCNRTAVHNQLLQHGFQTSWRGGLRVSTSSSAASATALIAVIVQTGCGFLSGGRRGATQDDREDCFGRATVALTRSIQHTYIVSPIDLAGMIGMAQTLAVFHYGYHTLKRSNTSLRIKDECLIFTSTKICSNVNKLTRKKKPKPSLNLNSGTYFELHMSL